MWDLSSPTRDLTDIPGIARQILFLKKSLINLFIYHWLCWVLVAICRLSLVVVSGSYPLVGLLIAVASLVAERRL